jgi:hypothetical protein
MIGREPKVSILVAMLLVLSLAAPISADISPPVLIAELAPGESIDEQKLVSIPAASAMADVIFAFDLTTSMGDIIDTAKARAAEIIGSLDAIPGVDIQYGVMSYMDYPYSYDPFCGYPAAPYGIPDIDYAYSLDQAVTDDSAAVIAAINALEMGVGGDDPEDYTRIMYESYADPSVGWRIGAKRILVNFGDSVPHDCDLNEGVPGEIEIWSTGGDPGRDAFMDTADDLDLQAVLSGMQANGVILLECHTTEVGDVGDEYDVDFENYWTHWTGLTGGGFYITGSGSLVGDIVAAVLEGLGGSTVYDLHLEASPGFESWLWSVTPESYPEVDAGETVSFDVTIGVPEGTDPGEYNFAIGARDGDGVSYGDQQVTITVVSGEPPIPGGGFVTAGGWIYSDPGNYAPDPTLEGKANFGFVSKYKKGANVPTGQTEFQFQVAALNFHSSSYDWLMVDQAGTSAQFMGSGTINRAGDPNGQDYRFMLWAGDGDPDTFRIKIWWEDGGSEVVVFDNGFGQELNGGSIVIHTGK